MLSDSGLLCLRGQVLDDLDAIENYYHLLLFSLMCVYDSITSDFTAGLHKDILKSARDISDSIQRQLKQQTAAKNKNDDDDGDITDDDNVKEDLQKLRERVDAIEKKHVKVTVKSQVEHKTQTSEKGSGTGEDGKRKAGIDEDEDEDEEDGDVMEEFDKGRWLKCFR